MAYTDPVLKWSDERSDEDDKTRRYYAGWTLYADALDDAYSGMGTIGVVRGGTEATVYPGKRVKSLDINRLGASTLYSAVAGFESSDDGSTTPPEQRPWFVEWVRGNETVAIDRDTDGNPIVNTALDPIEGITEENQRLYLRIIKWESTYNARKAITFEKTVNSDTLHIVGYDFDPGEVALMDYMPTSRIEYTPGGVQVPDQVEVMYLFEFRGPRYDFNGDAILDHGVNTGFYDRVMDQGANGWYLDDDGNTVQGHVQTKDSNGEYVDVTTSVRMSGGSPVDDSFFIAGRDSSNWTSPSPNSAMLVDDSNPDADFLLIKRRSAVAYAAILD